MQLVQWNPQLPDIMKNIGELFSSSVLNCCCDFLNVDLAIMSRQISEDDIDEEIRTLKRVGDLKELEKRVSNEIDRCIGLIRGNVCDEADLGDSQQQG